MSFPPSPSPQDSVSEVCRHWQSLNQFLLQHQSLWLPVPFMEPEPSWVSRWPALADWLGNLDDDHCEVFEGSPEQLANGVSAWLPDLAGYPELVGLADLNPGPAPVAMATLAEPDAVGMPGRKRLQAGAYTAALLPLDYPLLDWCCGKGHLSRTLSRQGAVQVVGYEWNRALVADGNRLAQRYKDAVTLQCRDVMANDLSWPDQYHGAALHACGDLHRKLLRDGVAQQQPRLSISPCCYHLANQAVYTPLSEQARHAEEVLSLAPEDMRLAVRETVTASAGVRRQTALASQFRLGFDGLQRWLRGVDEYLPLQPHPKRLMKEGFESFCGWAADHKGLAVPEGVDYARWLDYGRERAARVRRYELLRHLFRRPLELWIVLDYAMFLEESGYSVRLGTFCARELTPRNLLLDARLQRT